MIGPTWLAAIFGVIMLAAAVVALVRIIAAWRSRGPTNYGVDIHNVLMGASMAGMLIPPLLIVTPGPSTVAWLGVWILVTGWFASSVGRQAAHRTDGNRFSGHHLPHLVMSAAMIYMFAVMLTRATGSSPSGMSGMSALGGSGGIVPWPTLDYAFVIFMIGYAVLVIDRLPALATNGRGHLVTVGPPATGTAATPLAPTTDAVINIVMAITMAYMLTMMFA